MVLWHRDIFYLLLFVGCRTGKTDFTFRPSTCPYITCVTLGYVRFAFIFILKYRGRGVRCAFFIRSAFLLFPFSFKYLITDGPKSDPSCLQFEGYLLFTRSNICFPSTQWKLITYLHLVPRFKVHEVVPPPPIRLHGKSRTCAFVTEHHAMKAYWGTEV
jgi:hypothetical protein